MRGANLDFVRDVARKKPAVKQLLDSFMGMSDAEIQKSPVPGWVKNVLIREKERCILRGTSESPETIAQRIAAQMESASPPKEEKYYQYGIYRGSEIDIGTRLIQTLEPDSIILFIGDGCIKYAQSIVPCNILQYEEIKKNTEMQPLGVTISVFQQIYQEYVSSKT